MLESQFLGEESTIQLTKSELNAMIDEAKMSAHEEGMKENKKLREALRIVSELIKIVVDE